MLGVSGAFLMIKNILLFDNFIGVKLFGGSIWMMLEIAGVQAASGQFRGDGWAADLVRTNRLKHAVGGVRHVAVVTLAAGGVGGVMGVRRQGLWFAI